MRVYVSACISVIKEGRPGRESEGEGRGRRERTWREMERNRGRGGRERERSAREEEENGRAGRESREGEEGGGRNLKEGGKGRGGSRWSGHRCAAWLLPGQWQGWARPPRVSAGQSPGTPASASVAHPAQASPISMGQ
jgi:hypothetical protein